jgi:hypothetical protein
MADAAQFLDKSIMAGAPDGGVINEESAPRRKAG